ncbi:MAG: VWA domain-containing protein [Planctomycetes bacterium]|nr:VWA domain-containing protein [Planctomycetota bacterium]
MVLSGIALGLALAGCGGGGASGSGGGPGTVTGELTLNARVSSSPPANVSILFEATDRLGQPVADLLTRGSIQLFENGQRVSPFESRQRIQPIGRQIAFSTLLLLDLSGSIVRSGNLPRLKDSARRFVETLLDPASANAQAREIAVAYFPGTSTGRGIRIVSDFSTDIARIQAEIDAIRGAPDTTTNLNEAILRGFEALDARQAELLATTEVELTEGSLAVFTDGTDRAGTVPLEDVLTAIETTPNRVFTIGLQGEIDEGVLRQIGRSGFVLVDDIQNLQARFQEVANTIRAAANRFYAVEYCSPKRGGEHQLTVVATIGDSSGATTTRFDASAFRAGCRVPEGAAELSGADDAQLTALAFDPADGGFLAAGRVRGAVSWFGRARTAQSGGDGFVTRILPPAEDGTPPQEVWSTLLPGAGDAEVLCLAPDGDGACALGGSFTADLAIGSVPLVANGADTTAFVAKLAETGAPSWARSFAGQGLQRVVDVAWRADAVLVLGEFAGTVQLDGHSAVSAGDVDLFLAELDASDGTCRSILRDGGPGAEHPAALAVAADGRVAVAGSFEGNASLAGAVFSASGPADAFVALWLADGTPRFARAIGGAGTERATDLRFDLDSQLALSASFDAQFSLDGADVTPAGPARSGLVLVLAPTAGARVRHTVVGDASGGLATDAMSLAEDGIGNLYVAYSQTVQGQPEATLLGFAMIVPSGERLLDYTYATDAPGPVRIAIGPFGIDQGALCGPFSREATFGPFPLRYQDPFEPTAPLGGVNAFVGFIGPRS